MRCQDLIIGKPNLYLTYKNKLLNVAWSFDKPQSVVFILWAAENTMPKQQLFFIIVIPTWQRDVAGNNNLHLILYFQNI